jgi:hypothetical protein
MSASVAVGAAGMTGRETVARGHPWKLASRAPMIGPEGRLSGPAFQRLECTYFSVPEGMLREFRPDERLFLRQQVTHPIVRKFSGANQRDGLFQRDLLLILFVNHRDFGKASIL